MTNNMNNKIYSILFIVFCFQFTFSQKTIDKKYEKVKELFNEENYLEADSLIKEVKRPYKSVPPRVAHLEILIKDKLIKTVTEIDFSLIEETKKLVANYKSKFVKYQNDNYKEVVKIGNELNKYPKDLASFNAIKEAKQKEIALDKEIKEKQALEAKQKAEAERIKKLEEDKIKRIVSDRKDRLRPYVNPETFSEYELARLSEIEFNEQLDKAIRESIAKKEEEKKIKEIENHRLTKLQPYLSYVNSYDTYNLGTFSEKRFEEIFDKAKSDFKAAEKRNRPQLGSFSSIGFQSGEIAKYGFIYESGGIKTVGFRISARTSLTSEQDILNGTATKNKTEIEIGPNFRILNRLYLNIGFGYGYYERLLNNDFAGDVFLEKTGYSVATTGLMFRISRTINLNVGAAFMDLDKDLYKPEFTFGVTYNLKNKNDSEINSSQSQQKRKSVSTRNYKSNLSSFSSLGFYGGKNAKYGLFYETGGNKVTGFHVSARTSLKEETIINGQLILNRSELAIGPNFRMSNRLYLNLGVGYGIYDYGLSNDIYMGTDDYFTANAGIMFRVSKVININAGYSFENFDIEYNKPEMTFGISFNIWD
jgi:hypothetical protein